MSKTMKTATTTAITESYKAMDDRHQTEYHALFTDLRPLVFYAFGDKQFNEALDEYLKAGGDRSQLVAAFGGLYGQEDKVDELFALMKRQGAERSNALRSNKTYAVGAFRYEMDNHEYGWSEDDETVLESLGLTTDDLTGDLADWYEEARTNYLDAVKDYVW